MGSGVGARRGGGRAGAVAVAPGHSASLNMGRSESTVSSLTPDNTGAFGQPAGTLEQNTAEIPHVQEMPRHNLAEMAPYTSLTHLTNPNSETAAGYYAAFGQGNPPQVIMSERAQESANTLFRRPMSEGDLAALVGAPNGSIVRVHGYGPEYMEIDVRHPLIEGTQSRSVYRNRQGQLEIHNNVFEAKDHAPRGFGAAIFSQQVAQARKMGVQKITVEAAGHPGSTMYNGYYTWARFGYNANIDPGEIRRPMPPSLRSNTLNELMQKPGGPAWWKANGHSFDGTFDLNPKSVSSRILRYYMQERGVSTP